MLIKEKALQNILKHSVKARLSDTLGFMYKKGCDKVWFNGIMQNTQDVINDICHFDCDYIVLGYQFFNEYNRCKITLDGGIAVQCNYKKERGV